MLPSFLVSLFLLQLQMPHSLLSLQDEFDELSHLVSGLLMLPSVLNEEVNNQTK